MKKINLAFCLIVLLLIFSACSKAKRTERHLCKDGGEWIIKKYTVYTHYNGFPVEGGGVADAGKMVFSKNGSMVWTETLNNETAVYNCAWSNKKEELTIVRDGVTYLFKIESESKTEMQIRHTETFSEDGMLYETRTTLKLER